MKTSADDLDSATARLHERIISVEANARFLNDARDLAASEAPAADLVGIVPGAFYREHRATGADGARVAGIAKKLSLPAERISIESFGPLDANARIILDWLARHRERRLALISLSKGGADIKRALASPDAHAAFANVAAWISFSGIVQGTPLIDWLRRRPLRWQAIRLWLWWRGHSRAALDDLRHNSDGWPPLPPGLWIVHVLGIPQQRHLAHPWAHRGSKRLAPLGPNDGGGILLEDCMRWPGIVCPVWGADHYLMPSWDIDPLLTGIVTSALRQASQSQPHPSNPPAARSSA